MSIGGRVLEGLQHQDKGNTEGALLAACVALDATAKKENPHIASVGERCKKFVAENMWVISWVGIPGMVTLSIRVPSFHSSIRADAQGNCFFEDVVYHVIRCSLVHEASLADCIEFVPEITFGCTMSKYKIYSGFPVGLLAAVVLSPANRTERTEDGAWMRLGERVVTVNSLWGRRDDVAKLLAEESRRRPSA